MKCIAYTDDGTICRLPATVLDQERGGMVCDDHAPVVQIAATCPTCDTPVEERELSGAIILWCPQCQTDVEAS